MMPQVAGHNFPQDPSLPVPKIVKPYSGTVGDAFAGVPASSGGYPPYNAKLALGPGIGRPPTLPPNLQHAPTIVPR